ncbi:unnamed protein product, partial [Wuchereria bancrofti]
QTSVTNRTDPSPRHYCYTPAIATATATVTITVSTCNIAVTAAITALTVPHLNNYCTGILMNEQYSTTCNDKLKKTIRNGAALNGVDMTVHDSSSSDLYVHSSSSGGLENIDPEINSKKGKGQQKNYLKEREKMEKSDEEEEEEGINGRLPIRLIHQPSEEGFHQVVKFTKRATRRGEKELPKAKSFAFAEFSEEEKSSSKRENISSIAISRDSTSIRFQSEYCKPDDKTYLKSANANTNSYYLNCDTTELQHLNCESVCAESEVLDETMIEADNLPQQIHKKHDQQECDRTKICLENCGSQTDEESKIWSRIQWPEIS